ncbi:hypothetical protein Tco_0548216 [Tanacetum coccineum]
MTCWVVGSTWHSEQDLRGNCLSVRDEGLILYKKRFLGYVLTDGVTTVRVGVVTTEEYRYATIKVSVYGSLHKQERVDMVEEVFKKLGLSSAERAIYRTEKQESKVDLSNALDVGLVVTKSSGTKSGKHDTSSRSGNDKDVDDADIRPIYDKESMAEDAEQCQVKSPLLDPSLDNKTTKFSNQSLKESVFAKPHHVIAPGSSRNSSKNASPLSLKESFGSNDMVHNYYLEEARKKTQERNRNSKPIVMPSVRLQDTTNGSKPKPRSNNQTSRNCPTSKSSCEMSNVVQIGDHSRNSIPFFRF